MTTPMTTTDATTYTSRSRRSGERSGGIASRLPGSAGFGALLELLRARANHQVAHAVLDRTADEHPEDAPRVDLQRVGGGRGAVRGAERPRALKRLEVALLLLPGE